MATATPEAPPAGPQTATPKTEPRPEAQTDQPLRWNVVLLDDQEHTYQYVIEMMQKLFGHPLHKAVEVAMKVDLDGRAVCLTTHKEHAELKRDQIHAYGPDRLIMTCKGSMSAIIEPAIEEGDEGENGDREKP